MTPSALPTPSLSMPAVPAAADGSPTIVHLTAEYAPYARTGGLAEAVNGLATFQARAGAAVVVYVPV
jgi:starch synthase